MKLKILVASPPMILFCAFVFGSPEKLSPPDEAAAFKAAGFKLKGKKWRACDDPTPTYTPGAIEQVRDINGDGYPEAIITEGGTYCYGNTGAGYTLVSKQANGSWKLITSGTGILTLLTTKGVGGWADNEIGGPGSQLPARPCRVHGGGDESVGGTLVISVIPSAACHPGPFEGARPGPGANPRARRT